MIRYPVFKRALNSFASRSANYDIALTSQALKDKFNRVTSMKEEYTSLLPRLSPSSHQCIQAKLHAYWIADSNQIEGVGLQGITVSGYPLSAYLLTRNHTKAIDFLYEKLNDDLTVFTLKQLHTLLLKDTMHSISSWNPGLQRHVQKSFVPGRFKLLPNSVLKQDGRVHQYVDPLQVEPEMEDLVRYINNREIEVHPVERAAIAHYNFVRIHPFDDGNGRMARLLMNLILIKDGYIPCVVHLTDRDQYYTALESCDNGNLSAFVEFISNQAIKTYDLILADVRLCAKHL